MQTHGLLHKLGERLPFARALPSYWDTYVGRDPVVVLSACCTFFLAFYFLFFPFGRIFRELGADAASVAAGILLAFFFPRSTTRNAPALSAYALFLAFLFFKIFHSIDIAESFYTFYMNILASFLLFPAAMESVRSPRDAARFTLCLAVMVCLQGADGIYQALTGFDLVQGTSVASLGGRLSGSFSTYRVGNLLAMAIPAAAGMYALLRMPSRLRLAVTALVLAPGCFLLLGSQTRSALLGLGAGGLTLWFCLARPGGSTLRRAGLTLLVLGLLGFLVLALLPGRYGLTALASNPRLAYIWPAAVEAFASHPFLGVGIGAFGKVFAYLGLPGEPISHPHNIYLQLLAETGLVGFGLFLAWILSTYRFLLRSWHRLAERGGEIRLLPYYLAGHTAFLASGLTAHGFFRTWWLGFSMALLGVAVGLVLAVERPAAKTSGETR